MHESETGGGRTTEDGTTEGGGQTKILNRKDAKHARRAFNKANIRAKALGYIDL